MSTDSRRSRWLAPAVIAVIALITIVLIVESLVRGPRVHLQGYLRIVSVNAQTCVFIETVEPGHPVWTIVQLPAGYSAVAATFDPRFAPGAGRITGPDGTVAQYLDFVDVEGKPVPAVSDDPCESHPAISVLGIKRQGFGP